MAEQAKATEGANAPEDKTQNPEQGAEKKETKATAKKQAKATEGGKVYNFKSANKFLTCAGLGVQFMDGTASTTNLEVAKELAKLDGVELIEE